LPFSVPLKRFPSVVRGRIDKGWEEEMEGREDADATGDNDGKGWGGAAQDPWEIGRERTERVEGGKDELGENDSGRRSERREV
jgi:hypothetical protein